MNEEFATISLTGDTYVGGGIYGSPSKRDGVIAGWFNTCKDKGYNVFCLNYNDLTSNNGVEIFTAEATEDYCLFVDDNKGEVMWYTK